MASTWKKIVVSGSNISQLNNDALYISSVGQGILSGSAQIATEISGAFTSVSSSLAGRVTTNTNDISALDGRIDTLENYNHSFGIAGDTGTDTVLDGETLTFAGDSGMAIAVTNNLVTIDASNASVAFADQASTAASADAVEFADVLNKPTLVSGSAQINLSQATGKAATAGTADTASYVAAANVVGKVSAAGTADTATTASFATYAATAGTATTATTATTANAVAFANITGKPTLVSGSVQIDHDATTNFVANEHINHANVSIIAGAGLTGGGDITTSRTLKVDSGSMEAYFSARAYAGVSGDITINSSGVATIGANSVALGTDTTGNYAASVAAGTNIIVTGSAGEGTAYTVSLPSTISGNHIFSNNLQVNGNLTVAGTTTTVNSTTVEIADKFILLAAGQGGADAIAEGGIIVEGALAGRGEAFYYDAVATNRWAVASDVLKDATNVTPAGFMAVAYAGNAAAATTAGFNQVGNIAADAVTGDIWIFS